MDVVICELIWYVCYGWIIVLVDVGVVGICGVVMVVVVEVCDYEVYFVDFFGVDYGVGLVYYRVGWVVIVDCVDFFWFFSNFDDFFVFFYGYGYWFFVKYVEVCFKERFGDFKMCCVWCCYCY